MIARAGHFLPGPAEITTFEHNCTAPPCVITQLHCPTAGPQGWDLAVVKIYVDGETSPSLSFTLLELANIGRWGHGAGPAPGDGGPWGIGLLGHTAKQGGVYSTVRIPFGSHVKTTITNGTPKLGKFWFIVRGVESYPIVVGDVELPPTARLKLHRLNASTVQFELVTLVNISKGTSGALLNLKFDASNSEYFEYLEACMRFYPDGQKDPTFLSSGAEDYFLSAYYFNEGEFKTPNSGLTYFDGKGVLSAYKTHDRDPIFFEDGMRLVFRNNELTAGCGDTGNCPNQYCPPGSSAVADHEEPAWLRDGKPNTAGPPTQYETLVWVYEWPKPAEAAAEPTAPSGLDVALSLVAELAAHGLITVEAEDVLVERLLGNDESLIALASAYSGGANGKLGRAARQLMRHLERTAAASGAPGAGPLRHVEQP